MSAVVRRADEMELPPHMDDVFKQELILQHLTPEGTATFMAEIAEAIQRAQRQGDFRPVTEVVETWYRTLIVRADPDYTENVAWAEETPPAPGHDPKELRKQLGL